METRKLYYEDCHLTTFSARVCSCEANGELWAVTLDATAFYPTGGGQLCDTGTLDEVYVAEVREEYGEILHFCKKPLEVGKTVTGKVNYAQRLDRMQQHTGEHIISGIINRRFGYHNTGFHMGGVLVTVDFDGMLSWQQILQIEAQANQIVCQNLPIVCSVPSPEALSQIPYRSKRALEYPVRIVEIPEVDICACCGVHTAFTGEVGLIKLFSVTKFHQGVRIEMACGPRAFCLMQRVFEENRRISQLFSAQLMETAEAAQRVQDALEQEKLRANSLQRQCFDYMAQAYAGRGNVLHIAEDLEPAQLRELCDRIARVCGGIAAVAGTPRADGKRNLCLIGQDDAVQVMGKSLCSQFEGRGGGRGNAFQGTLTADDEALQAQFSALSAQST